MPLFAPVGEKEITRELVGAWHEAFQAHTECDVVIVGGGPSGLVAAREVALAGAKVMVVESNNYLGGGFWVGGFMMSPLTVRAPANEVLEEYGIAHRESSTPGLFLTSGPEACSKTIAKACDAGVFFQNVTELEDIVLREGPEGKPRVGGVVINWSPIQSLPKQITCLDPVAVESKIVIDATGHDAVVLARLRDQGLTTLPGHGSMWIERSEDLVVEHTGEVYPGVIVAGMSVTTAYGLPRMGPTFGAMLLSGKKAGRLAIEALQRQGWTPKKENVGEGSLNRGLNGHAANGAGRNGDGAHEKAANEKAEPLVQA